MVNGPSSVDLKSVTIDSLLFNELPTRKHCGLDPELIYQDYVRLLHDQLLSNIYLYIHKTYKTNHLLGVVRLSPQVMTNSLFRNCIFMYLRSLTERK